jgi:hypothetical protein
MERKRIETVMTRKTLSSPFGKAGHVSANQSSVIEAQAIVRGILICLKPTVVISKRQSN